ncbi:MAG TPA: hypothetical protein VF017_20280 [Thermoanaerobaculia bacterium]|nr:hypothetical protein [Thermoanaerobaculia bacterium]
MKSVVTRAFAASVLALAAATAAHAGAVYVPLAKDVVVNGIRYQTQVWVSNKSETAQTFSTFFIPTETDGTARTGAPNRTSFAIGARSTLQLTGVAPANENGMLEIDGATQISVQPKVVAIVNGTEKLGAAVPVVSSDSLFVANSTLNVLNLERTAVRQSDFVLVNLVQQEAVCKVAAFRVDGSAIGPAGVVNLPALSHRQFTDVLGALGETSLAAARISVSCDKSFYAYALTFDTQLGEATVQMPAFGLDSTLRKPGDGTPPPAGCSAAAFQCFTVPGTFFRQVPPAVIHIREFDTTPGSYSKVHFRVEVKHGGWGNGLTSGPGGLFSLFWLVVDRNFNLVGFSVFRKPPLNDVMFRHGIGIPAGSKPKDFFAVEGIPGTTYIIDYTYNPAQRTLNYKLLDQAGNVLIDHNAVPNVNSLSVPEGSKLRADFGFNEGRNENEDPGYDWEYSNLLLETFR